MSIRVSAPAAVLAVAVAVAAALLTPTAAQAATGDNWTRKLTVSLSPSELGVPADGPPARLARAALARHAHRIGLDRSLRGVRLARFHGLRGGVHMARFQQTAGGKRLVWSQIDVTVVRDQVRSISAAVVPVAGSRAAGRLAISRNRALAVARRVAHGAEARRPDLVAYAGTPTTRNVTRRGARLAYLIQTTPAPEPGEDAPTGLCIVVDAETGKVLARWKGVAAVPLPASGSPGAPGRRARASATTTLIEIWDRSADPIALYARWETTGDPTQSPSWDFQGSRAQARLRHFRPRTTGLDRLAANAYEVAKYLCTIHDYCGRFGGGLYQPWQVFGNITEGSFMNGRSLAVFINPGDVTAEVHNDAQRNDTIAHELGHVMDRVLGGDRLFSRQGEEVEEALADMFAYDADPRDGTLAEDRPRGIVRNWQSPSSLFSIFEQAFYPARMADYKCDAEEHFNGTILSHAFFRLKREASTNDSAGHRAARRMLQGVIPTLDSRPSFFDVKSAFITLGGQLFPRGVDRFVPDGRAAAQRAFADAGTLLDPARKCGTITPL